MVRCGGRPVTISNVLAVALDILAELGYTVHHGPHIGPESATPERSGYGDVVLVERLQSAIVSLNPHIPHNAPRCDIARHIASIRFAIFSELFLQTLQVARGRGPMGYM